MTDPIKRLRVRKFGRVVEYTGLSLNSSDTARKSVLESAKFGENPFKRYFWCNRKHVTYSEGQGSSLRFYFNTNQ